MSINNGEERGTSPPEFGLGGCQCKLSSQLFKNLTKFTKTYHLKREIHFFFWGGGLASQIPPQCTPLLAFLISLCPPKFQPDLCLLLAAATSAIFTT